MRLSSCTWLSSLIVGLVAAEASAAPPRFCLPPVFEGGQRLQEPSRAPVLWLEPLLRQHELCRRARERPDERRVVLIGGSAPFGFPGPADSSVSAVMNASEALARSNAHVFNLAMDYPDLTKTALIARKALDYDPAVVVFGATLGEFRHVAPSQWPPTRHFFRENARDLARFAADAPAGIEEPVRLNSEMASRHEAEAPLAARRALGALGGLARSALRSRADRLARWVYSRPEPAPAEPGLDYDCARTLRRDANFDGWREWNVLLYLADLQREHAVDVLVVDWPVPDRSQGGCFNKAYSRRRIEEYSRWMRAETRRLGLRYLDFTHALPATELVGHAHVRAQGNERLAGWIIPELESILRAREARRSAGRPGSSRRGGRS